jgi:D-sedoheptulose 7-phosphate isomerase
MVTVVVKQLREMSLRARTTEFQGVIASMEVTGRSGARQDSQDAMSLLVQSLEKLRSRGGHLYLVGNGGSAGVASHAATDFLKCGKLRAATLYDPSLLTCMSNDYGYDQAFARILATLAGCDDVLFAISSSGQSANIRNAALEMCKQGGNVVTLTGFRRDNPLRSLGDLNIWLDSDDYGMVEIGHQFVLHNLADRIRLQASQ